MSMLSEPVRLRRIIAGIALIGCPLAGSLSAVFDADEGTDTPGAELYEIAAAHSEGIWLAGLLMALSALLTVPTAIALQHLSAGRGTALAHVGVIFLLLGGLGHMGYGTWQLMVAQMPGTGDRASLAAYFDRAAAVHDLLLPLMMSLILGLILLAVAAWRAGHLPLLVPCALLTVAIFDFVVQSTSLADNEWVPATSWALALFGLGYAGVRVLRMADGGWGLGSLVSAGTAPVGLDAQPGRGTCRAGRDWLSREAIAPASQGLPNTVLGPDETVLEPGDEHRAWFEDNPWEERGWRRGNGLTLSLREGGASQP